MLDIFRRLFRRSGGSAERPFLGVLGSLVEFAGGTDSTLYKASHLKSGKVYAVKRVPVSATAQSRRALSGIGAANRLDHPGIIKYHACEKKGDAIYILMDFIQGESLRKLLQQWIVGRKRSAPFMTARSFLRVFRQLAGALEHMHSKGLLHLDIKPEIVMLAGTPADLARFGESPETEPDPRVMLIDLGLAAPFEEAANAASGSVFYVAPEMVADEDMRRNGVDERTDVYSLGATMYELAAGEPPFLPEFFNVKKRNWNHDWHEYDRLPDHVKNTYEGDMLRRRLGVSANIEKIKYPAPVRDIVSQCLELSFPKRYMKSYMVRQDIERLL